MTRRQLTQEEILEVQARAVERGDRALLDAAWGALGYSRRAAFVEVSDWMRARCVEVCAAELDTRPLPDARRRDALR